MPKIPDLPPIHTIRRQRVMLDSDLARLYGVSTMAFNQATRRNLDRFPGDFVFQLTPAEAANLISQIVISSPSNRHGGRRKLPWAFTEHGAIMAATLLRSPRAVAMSVYVVRAFVQMKDALLTNATIFQRLAQIDKRLITHDVVLRDVYEKLRPLLCLGVCRRTQPADKHRVASTPQRRRPAAHATPQGTGLPYDPKETLTPLFSPSFPRYPCPTTPTRPICLTVHATPMNRTGSRWTSTSGT